MKTYCNKCENEIVENSEEQDTCYCEESVLDACMEMGLTEDEAERFIEDLHY